MKAHEKRHSDVTWKKNYTYYRISKANIQKMKALKKTLAFGSYNDLVSHFINSLASNDYPVATPEIVMRDSVPVILTGLPGSGKTTLLRHLVANLEGPVFVLDVHDEYCDLSKVSLGEFFGLDFKEEKRKLRFVPSSNPEVSRSEGDTIFQHLVMMQKALARWVVIIEEGHRFVRSTALRSVLAEGRKNIGKVLIVSHQVAPYRGLGVVLRVTR